MTIAVTGATGFVGCALREAAAEQGAELRALTRRKQPAAAGVEWIAGDLHDRKALTRLVAKAEAVIHVAGVVNTPDPMGFHLGNVEGTMALVEAAVAARVPRFVFVSSLAAREPQLSKYGASKRHAEKLVAASGLDWTIVRPPAIYGPRDREMFEMFRAARWGVLPMPPRGRASSGPRTAPSRSSAAARPASWSGERSPEAASPWSNTRFRPAPCARRCIATSASTSTASCSRGGWGRSSATR